MGGWAARGENAGFVPIRMPAVIGVGLRPRMVPVARMGARVGWWIPGRPGGGGGGGPDGTRGGRFSSSAGSDAVLVPRMGTVSSAPSSSEYSPA